MTPKSCQKSKIGGYFCKKMCTYDPMPRGGLGSQTGCGKNIKAALLGVGERGFSDDILKQKS